ncbi:dihydrofolate reductase family protein [Parafrigoribacterium mesophilum]|uniref:dihydrofolate reductase family protein n=1 Tax=Parafrigoribacterium mesophilum TaxID=433646 RepID=UPI0031FC1ACF
MGRLIYSLTVSLDGYITDENGNFDWSAPDEEVHGFVNDLLRPIGTYLFGRRMYETMLYWETAQDLPDQLPVERDFAAIWQAADKVVYSTTLAASVSAKTTLEHRFDPEAIRRWKAAAPHDLCVGGADLAGHAIRAGLVDEVHLFVVPVVVGGGTAALPRGIRLALKLLDEHRFSNGTVYLRYVVAG